MPMFTFSNSRSPALSSSVVLSEDRLTILMRMFMTSVKAVSQTSSLSISAHSRVDIPLSAAFTFWQVPQAAQVITLQSTAYDIFFLQLAIWHSIKVFTLSVNLNSSTVIFFLMLNHNSSPFMSCTTASMGGNVVAVVIPRCVFPLKFLTLRFYIS